MGLLRFVPFAAVMIALAALTVLFAKSYGLGILLLALLACTVFLHGRLEAQHILEFGTMALYITAGFYAIACGSRADLVFIVLAPCSTDTFAYFTGVFLGRHKLCPEISPKKTVEGAVGGILACVLVCTAADALFFEQSYPVWAAIPVFAGLSIVGQLGDLAASVVKRRYGVKDYGRLFPGHGGVLDRFDSILPTAIVLRVFHMIAAGI